MINIGFLGAGSIAGVHANAVDAVDGAQLIAVADTNPERAAQLAAKHSAESLSGLDELLAVGGLDLIYILTSPAGHAEQIKSVAQAGIPMMCEKPLTVTLAEADEALQVVEQYGVPLMTGFTHRFSPLSVEARTLLESGALGDLVATWSHRLIRLPVEPDSWLNDEDAGGGLSMQYAIHDLDWERWMGGEVAQLSAVETNTNPKLSIADNLWALLQFRSGSSGSVGVSWSAQQSHVERGVVGSRGNLRIIDQKRLVGKLDSGRQLDIDLGADYDWFDTFVRESQHIIDCVRYGRPFSVTGEDGRRSMELALAASEAARTHTMISLPLG